MFEPIRGAVRNKEEVILPSLQGLSGSVGILGGTFDPPHPGHTGLARAVMNAHALEKVIFVPAAQNPLKKDGPVASNEDRLEMIYLAIRGEKGLYVSACELEKGGASYTFDTLSAIHAASPEARLFFIVGADCLSGLSQWRNLEGIGALATIVAVSREAEVSRLDFGALKKEISPVLAEDISRNFVGGFHIPISSTQLRLLAAQGEDLSSALDGAVYRYIRKKGLYRQV